MSAENENESPTVVAPPSPPQWIDLPPDVTANILQRLDSLEILQNAENVCTTWRRVCSDPSIWRSIHIKHTHNWWRFIYTKHSGIRNEWIRNLWRRAVDRSQGQLLHLSIEKHSCDDDLLNYIVDRSSGIKHLTLNYGYGFTGKGLVEAFNKLPHLEELCLMFMPQIKALDIVDIGISCPVLKSFTIAINYEYKHDDCIYEYAVAIAKSMTNLQHLRLVSDFCGSEELEVILDGCPNLESLDLRQCFGLDLRGALGKRCCEQIKHLKLPCDNPHVYRHYDFGSGI